MSLDPAVLVEASSVAQADRSNPTTKIHADLEVDPAAEATSDLTWIRRREPESDRKP